MTEREKPNLSSLRIKQDKRTSDRPRSKKWLYFIWILVLVVIVIGYFSFKESIVPALKVKVTTVSLLYGSDAQASLVATGYVVAQRKAEVASQGTGRLEYLGFEEGDTVLSGEIIARLENDEIKANLEMARATLLKTIADSLNSSRNYKRSQKLYASGSIMETELENAETTYLMSRATVAEAVASVKAIEVALDNTYIKAPFDGTILTKNADVGEIVAPFASSASSKGSVVTLADMTSLEVEADVSESNIQKVSVGQRCEIILDAYPETRYPARVKKIVPTADRSRATVLTKVAFVEKDDRVLPEMSARINFFLDDKPVPSETQKPVVAVANDAITNRNGQTIVFKVENEHVTAVEIKTGRKLGTVTEVIEGINAGERIVISPPGKLKSGDKISISR